MSTLLEQAIVDAKALKEAALKNAEATIIDKYSEEVKSTLNRLLEQDDPLAGLMDMGGEAEPAALEEGEEEGEIAEGVPMAFTEDVKELDGVNEGDQTMVEVDFAELEEAIKALREQIEEDGKLEEEAKCDAPDDTGTYGSPLDENEEIEITQESIKAIVSELLSEEMEDDDDDEEEEEDEKEHERSESDTLEQIADELRGAVRMHRKQAEMIEDLLEDEEDEEDEDRIDESLIDAIMEKLTVDTGASLSGWAGRSGNDMKYQMELEMAHRRTTEVEEELAVLKKAQEELVFENKKLKDSLANHREAISTLKESVQDVNLSNARLLYTNRVLRDTSLNERQKTRIVEAISKAGSVEEAKTIHETLQSTVAAAPKASPQSLSEAITRPTSIIRASRKEEPKSDPFSARLRKLAGIE